MGTIIGEGITFDDVLLVPAYSQVIPNQVDLDHISDQDDQTEYSADECRNGYGYRTPYGNCHGAVRVVLVSFTKICQLKRRQKK